jgi:hypothetical protein
VDPKGSTQDTLGTPALNATVHPYSKSLVVNEVTMHFLNVGVSKPKSVV